ncbi:Hypothetical protein GLP15_4602 [Giardia lamblia P15]|uniref:Uncharacterized protein n=1 Tax=Giardia intestinalis (strain P15) TaxID=658858 RepID=E1F7P8_GIAIA|nr:Hypothetical protein GLP15_4602 [Giardia lamblia P15]
MQLDCTALVALLKSGGMSSVRLFELAQPLLRNEATIASLYSKLIDVMKREFDWSEECKKPLSVFFFERAYEFFIAVLPLTTFKHETQLIELFTFTEHFLTYQITNHSLTHYQLVFLAEKVNDKAIDILGCTSKSTFDLCVGRYNRLLNVLFGPSITPNFRILALQRIIQHISQVIVQTSSDTVLAALVYLLTDMTLNIDIWTVDTIISLFNHATQLALSTTSTFQCLFTESLIETMWVLASNTLVYSFFDSKHITALSRTLLRSLLLLLDKQDVLDKIKETTDVTRLISGIGNIALTLEDQDIKEHYDSLLSILGLTSGCL